VPPSAVCCRQQEFDEDQRIDRGSAAPSLTLDKEDRPGEPP
jgi:hypothetical protein